MEFGKCLRDVYMYMFSKLRWVDCDDFFFYLQVLILIARAANIFPLSAMMNCCRSVKIHLRMQFVMWFSGQLLPCVLSVF